jgi:tRNA threonylcarbamoyladenosine biosynthesis protein TsaE
MCRFEQLLANPDETAALGRRLGKLLSPGMVIALTGPLGAGKTTLTQAIAQGLGVDPHMVGSPTFALVHEYPGRVPVYHFDAYRLPSLQAFMDLGSDEYFQGTGVCLIEWADRVAAALPADHLCIKLAHESDGRRITIEAVGKRSQEVLRMLCTQN